MDLRFRGSLGYIPGMRVMFTFLRGCVAVLAMPVAVFAQSGMDLGEVVREGGDRIALAVESGESDLRDIARRAFSLHGGYALAPASRAGLVVRLERSGARSVTAVLSSGRPARERARQQVSGSDLRDAVLRACDRVVEATLETPGFFAGKLAFAGEQRGASEIYVSDLLFNRVRPLTRDRALVTGPSWAPDGDKLLYTTYHESGFPDIYEIDLATNRRQPIATFKGTNSGGAYSPDGRRIAMVLSGTGNSELYVANAIGKNLRRLTTNKSLEAAPSWSPDGRRIVYTSDAPGKPQLFEISSRGGPSRRLPTDISGYCAEPDWNPADPGRIAFTAAVRGGFQIAVYDARRRSSEIVTSVRDSAVEPDWLNDGRHLVFTQRREGRTRLMLLDTESGKVSALHKPGFGNASSADFVY